MPERPSDRRTPASLLLATLIFAACSGGDGPDPVDLGEAVFPWALQATFRTGSPCYLDGMAEDFDGDGHLDFILQEGLGLRVRLGRGGRFVDGPLTLLPLAVLPPNCGLVPLAAFHLGADRDLDLVVTDYFETFVLENQGDGSFAVVGTLGIDPFTVERVFAGIDLDGDGRREFVEVEFSGLVRHWQQTQTQGFVGVPVGTFGERILTLAGHDLDGDGDRDLIGGVIPNGDFLLLRNDGGSFTPLPTFDGKVPNGDFVDQSGDGIVDYVGILDDTAWWYENDGSGTFGPPQVLGSVVDTVPLHPVLVDDLDGNGLPDLVDGSGLHVYLQRSFGVLDRYDLPEVHGRVYADDLDGDGVRDLVVRSALWMVTVPLDATGVPPASSFLEFPGLSVHAVAPARLTAAGPDELVVLARQVAGSQTPSTLLVVGVTGGEFQIRLAVPLPPLFSYGGISIFDADGDGHQDVISISGGSVVELRGDGSGALAAPTTDVLPGAFGSTGAGDLDGDCDADWVSVGPAKIYLRTASGSYDVHPGPYFWAAPYPITLSSQVEIRDADGDGIADVLYLDRRGASPGVICYGLGGSPPGFAFPVPIGDVNPPTTALDWLSVDVDADGIPDYVDVTRPGWLRGDGSGRTVGGVRALPPELQGMFASLGDLDGDGERNDLLVHGTDGSRGWFRHPGGGFSQGPRSQTPGVAPLAILRLVGDLDGDGFDDLVGYRDRWLFFHPNSGAGGR